MSIVKEFLEPWACNPCGKESKPEAVSYCHTCDEHFCVNVQSHIPNLKSPMATRLLL